MTKQTVPSQRREQRQARRAQPSFQQPAFRQPQNHWPPLEIASPERIERIHRASLDILERIGLRFLDSEALDLWERAGAKVDHSQKHVWLERGLVMELVKKAPSSFTMRARNPARSLTLGKNFTAFHLSAGMVNVSNIDLNRREGTEATYQELLKLAQQLNVIHFAGMQAVAMADVPISNQHLLTRLYGYTLSDKVLLGVSHGRIIAGDCLEAAKLVFGADLTTGGPVTGGVINVNSPLLYDERMLGGLITFARAGQVNIITPFILAGAMSPVSIPATMAQQNAEVLAGVALTQLIHPGAPVIYGGFTTNADMRSGSPALGTPEGAWGLLLGAQLARYYDLPYRGSGSLNTANLVDAQAAYESLWTLWPAIQAHTNLILHAAGWLEGGLTISYEKLIIDAENLAMMAYFLENLDWQDQAESQDSFLLDTIAEVGPGGHHFATPHTQANYRTAFFDGALSSRSNYGAWTEAGQQDAAHRAAKHWQTLLRDFEAPKLDEGIREALEAFVARRQRELQHVNLYD